MADPSSSGSSLVEIDTASAGSPTLGPGGWAAVLAYGEHVREIHDCDVVTTADQMSLLAVVRALECLTRPVRVHIDGANGYVRRGVSEWLPEWRRSGWTRTDNKPAEHVDLWLRLATETERHAVEWNWAGGDPSAIGHERARELARQEQANATARRPARTTNSTAAGGEQPDISCDQLSLDSVLTRFLVYRATDASRSTMHRYEDVISTLRWSIGRYASKKVDSIPANELPDHLGDFCYALFHKDFASQSKLKAVKTVVPALLKWMHTQGLLDSATVKSEIEDLRESIDEHLEDDAIDI